MTAKLIGLFVEGAYDDKLSEFIEDIFITQTKMLDQKLDKMNNREIHFLTKQELIKKIDIIVFSDYYEMEKNEQQVKMDFAKVMFTKMRVKSMAKNLKSRFIKIQDTKSKAPPIIARKVVEVHKTDEEI